MRLSKDGYLGIGSGGVSPAAALDVHGNGNQIWIRPGRVEELVEEQQQD